MKIYGLTDKGIIREANEDCIGITFLSGGPAVAVVCDGMGGAKGGRTASELAERAFTNAITPELFPLTLDGEKLPPDVKKVKRALSAAVAKANEAVFTTAREHQELRGMGCTLNAAVYYEREGKLCFANVGDSRLYMITEKEIKLLSRDHSYVQHLVDSGKISPEEAESHPQKNLITRAVGIEPSVKADVSYIKVSTKKPAYFLLCSDGLHGLIPADEIKSTVLGAGSVEDKVISLINGANLAGGTDNISAILLEINENQGGARK